MAATLAAGLLAAGAAGMFGCERAETRASGPDAGRADGTGRGSGSPVSTPAPPEPTPTPPEPTPAPTEPTPAPTEPTPAPDTADRIDDMLNNATNAADGIGDWFSRQSRAAREKFDAAVASARQKVPPAYIGVRRLMAGTAAGLDRDAPGVGPAPGLGIEPGAYVWAPLDAVRPSTPAAAGADGAQAAPAEAILLIEGLDSIGGTFDDLWPRLHAASAGAAIYRFEYSGDRPLADSTAGLAEALRDLRLAGHARVFIIAHSAGGLLARDVLTRPAFYNAAARPAPAGYPDIPLLIMVGTPNAGTPMARLRALAEARLFITRWMDADSATPADLIGALGSRAGPAADDLLPASAFLTELNARNNAQAPVGCTVIAIVGTAVRGVDRDLKKLASAPWVSRALGETHAKGLQESIAAMGQSIGDGIVPLESQQWSAAHETILVQSDHRQMIRTTTLEQRARSLVGKDPKAAPALGIIADRLAEARAADVTP
jgi:hypothetical protein